jgi:hypothetical protein
MEKFCNCKTVGVVARDMKSTCMQCGGVDAYKKSKLRISDCGCRFENNESNAVLLDETVVMCHNCMISAGYKKLDQGFHTAISSNCAGCGRDRPILPMRHWTRST